jgi:hypothetical protein
VFTSALFAGLAAFTLSGEVRASVLIFCSVGLGLSAILHELQMKLGVNMSVWRAK